MAEAHARLQHQSAAKEAAEEKRRKWEEVLEREEQEKVAEHTDTELMGQPLEVDTVAEVTAIMMADVPGETLEGNLAKMNADERRIFDKITSHLEMQWLYPEFQVKPLRMFVSGSGGTGKSFLINTLRLWGKRFYGSDKVTIAVAARTGLAAFNVNGMTLHRLFALPVQHGAEAGYESLGAQNAKLMRVTFDDLKLVIMDEISMTSSLLLAYVHKRLCGIFNTDENDVYFGGVNVLVMGDLAQLLPVRADPVFLHITGTDLTKKLRGMGKKLTFGSDAFRDYEELKESMRHKEDPDYAQLLERVRIGNMTNDDVKTLQRNDLLPRWLNAGPCASIQGGNLVSWIGIPAGEEAPHA